MGPFLTVALDVPRRMARSKLLWLLVVVTGILLLAAAVPLGFGKDGAGKPIVQYLSFELGPLDPADPESPFKWASSYLTLIFAKYLACYLGVFCGLLLLADAVPNAFAPGSAEVVLPKPVHRATIVCARELGAVLVALGLATFLVGGATGIVFLRTGIFCPMVLVTIPIGVLEFAALHALGTVVGLAFQSPLLGAFASAFVWIASGLTGYVAGLGAALGIGKPDAPHDTRTSLMELTVHVARVAHRTLPRAADIPDLVERIPTRNWGTVPELGVAGEVEILAQATLWVALALVLASLVVRKRDY